MRENRRVWHRQQWEMEGWGTWPVWIWTTFLQQLIYGPHVRDFNLVRGPSPLLTASDLGGYQGVVVGAAVGKGKVFEWLPPRWWCWAEEFAWTERLFDGKARLRCRYYNSRTHLRKLSIVTCVLPWHWTAQGSEQCDLVYSAILYSN